MAGPMDQAVLVAELKASLLDAANAFTAANDADFIRHLDHAALDFGRIRKRTLVSSLTLSADQAEYAAPADMVAFKLAMWGVDAKASTKPWQKQWPGHLPRIALVGDPGSTLIVMTPSPSLKQITLLGDQYRFYYYAGHVVGDGVTILTTIRPADRALLLLRAMAEAMKELAMRNSKKPVSLRDGLNSQPKNGTPAALYDQLMKAFEALA